MASNLMHTLARISAGMPAVDNDGHPTGPAVAQAVQSVIAGPELDANTILQRENAKLKGLLAARETDNAQLTAAVDALTEDA